MERLRSYSSGSQSAAAPVLPRPDENPEPEALLAAYEAALIAPDGTSLPPNDTLLAALKEACKTEVPLSALDLRGAALGRAGARPLSAVLQLDSFVTFINLEENDLGDDGVSAVADALRTHPTVFRLDLGYNGIGGRGVKALAALLLDSGSLLCLDLSGNNLYSRLSMLAPASLSALAPLGRSLASPRCKLQLLHLDNADIEPKGLSALVDGLLVNETVVNLRLGENALDARSATVLGKLLKGNQTLTSIDLRENALKDEGCAAVGEALALNSGLKCLVLWNNGIGGAGVRSLSQGIAANTSLQVRARRHTHGWTHGRADRCTHRCMDAHIGAWMHTWCLLQHAPADSRFGLTYLLAYVYACAQYVHTYK